jgi:hypothetical protein
MKTLLPTMLVVASFCVCALGCGRADTAAAKPAIPAERAQFLLTAEPEGAVGVMKMLAMSADNEEIVVVGRVGGGMNPWVDGVAAFMLLENSITAGCDDECAEGCYCGAEAYTDASTLVKICDTTGRPLKIDARDLLGVKEKEIVVVKGRTQRGVNDVTVIASGVHIRR